MQPYIGELAGWIFVTSTVFGVVLALVVRLGFRRGKSLEEP